VFIRDRFVSIVSINRRRKGTKWRGFFEERSTRVKTSEHREIRPQEGGVRTGTYYALRKYATEQPCSKKAADPTLVRERGGKVPD